MELRRSAPPSAHQPERASKEPTLPIECYEQAIREQIRTQNNFILIGETGSGKSTCTPEFILTELGPDEKAVVLQPRRVAVRSVAKHVAQRRGQEIGDEIGYQVRFDRKTGSATRLTFMTDGLLLRQLQSDPLLSDLSLVMVDEAHERSVNIDITLGLLKHAQQLRKKQGLKPLKIVVASATIEQEKFAAYFSGAPVLTVPGRLHPIQVHYESSTPPMQEGKYIEATAQRIKKIIADPTKIGDILVFMPGRAEVDATIRALKEIGIDQAALLLPLFGEQTPEEQDRIFEKTIERKIIVATNIAETSLTIPSVRIVVDSGLIKQTSYDARSGIEHLSTIEHARSGCNQRAGRAGRVAPGECYRLCSKDQFESRDPFQTPEIKRSNPDHIVLRMKSMGIHDVFGFDFIDPPKPTDLFAAIETLKNLGALNENEDLTEKGLLMADLPLKPELASMVIEAQKTNCVNAICTVCAFIGLPSVFQRPKDRAHLADAAHGTFCVRGSDFLTLLKVWEAYEKLDRKARFSWARDNFLNIRVLEDVQEIRFQLFQTLKQAGIPISTETNPEAIQKAVVSGMLKNLMVNEQFFNPRTKQLYASRRLSDGQSDVFIHPSSTLSNPRVYVALRLSQTTKLFAQTCQVVKPEWLPEIAPHLITQTDRNAIEYNQETDEVTDISEIRLRGTVAPLNEVRRPIRGEKAVKAFASALAYGQIPLPCVEHNRQVLSLARSLATRAQGDLPDPDTDFSLSQWYQNRLGTASSQKEASLLGEELRLSLSDFCSTEMQADIERNYPTTLSLGSTLLDLTYTNIQTDYFSNKKTLSATAEIDRETLTRIHDPLLVGPADKQIPVTLSVYFDGFWYKNTDPTVIRREIAEAVLEEAWNRRLFGPHANELASTSYSLQPGEPLPALEDLAILDKNPVAYAKTETGEPVYAYPTFFSEQEYQSGVGYINRYGIRYERTKEIANETYAMATRYREKDLHQYEESLRYVREMESLKKDIDSFTDELRTRCDLLKEAPSDPEFTTTQQALFTLQQMKEALETHPSSGLLETQRQQLAQMKRKILSENEAIAAAQKERSALEQTFQVLTKKMDFYFSNPHLCSAIDLSPLSEQKKQWNALSKQVQDKTHLLTPSSLAHIKIQFTHWQQRFAEAFWSDEEQTFGAILETSAKKNARCLEIRDGMIIASQELDPQGLRVSMPKRLQSDSSNVRISLVGNTIKMHTSGYRDTVNEFTLPTNGLVIAALDAFHVYEVEKSNNPTNIHGWRIIREIHPQHSYAEHTEATPYYSSSEPENARVRFGDLIKQAATKTSTKPSTPPAATTTERVLPKEEKKEEMTEPARALFLRQFRALSQTLKNLMENLPPEKNGKEKISDKEKKEAATREKAKERRAALNTAMREVEQSENLARVRGLLVDYTKQVDSLVRSISQYSQANAEWPTRYRQIVELIPDVERAWGDQKLSSEAFDRISSQLIALAKEPSPIEQLKSQIDDLIAEAIIS